MRVMSVGAVGISTGCDIIVFGPELDLRCNLAQEKRLINSWIQYVVRRIESSKVTFGRDLSTEEVNRS